MKMDVNVKTVSRYSFTNETTGELIQGTKITYEGDPVNTDTKKGIELIQLTSNDPKHFDEFTKVPGRYEVEFHIQPAKSGVKMVYDRAKLIN